MEIKSNRLDYETAIMGLKQTLQYGNIQDNVSNILLRNCLKQTLQYGNFVIYSFDLNDFLFKIDFIVWKSISGKEQEYEPTCLKQTLQYGNVHR